jgi:N-acetylmuramoyl-L-alanine amidase
MKPLTSNRGGFLLRKIFIDAGHGGADAGATAHGLKEKDLCLAIALKLRDILKREYAGHALHLSRTTDRTLTLKQRTDKANRWGADYLVSIHINAGGGTGFESYIYNGTYGSKGETNRLRGLVHDSIVAGTGFRDRGKKEANFHMLRESAMPGMLSENGFIDTAADSAKLKSDVFLNKIARGHALGLARALGLQKKNASGTGAQVHLVQKGDTLWQMARKYNVTVNRLLELNPGIEPERLQIGQKITIK